MAFTLAIAYRCWTLLTRPSSMWLATSLALSAGDVAWRQLDWDSYMRWRQLPAALMRLNAFAPTAAWRLMRGLLDDHMGATLGGSTLCAAGTAGAAAAQVAAHLARLLFASGGAKMAANALSLRTHLSLSAAVQLLLVLATGRHTRSICAAAPLAAPPAQRWTRHVHRLLSALSGMGMALPEPLAPPPADPVQECAAVITWLRFSLAFILPLLHEAASEARLWRQHQAQRQREGLRQEQGVWEAGVYAAVDKLGWGGGDDWIAGDAALHNVLVVWLLLAAAWQWCAAILRL